MRAWSATTRTAAPWCTREIVAALRAGDAHEAGRIAAAYVWLTAEGAAVEPDPRIPRAEPA